MMHFARGALLACATLFASPAFAVPSGQSAPVTDASSLTITGIGSNVPRTAAARAADEINALDFSTFQAAAAQAASAGKVLRLPPGSYSYTSGTALTVSAPVIFDPGAVLACSGANVVFASVVQAPRTQIFAANCKPSFWGDSRQGLAYPEWWGAAGDSNASSTAANTTAFANLAGSGVAGMSLAANAYYYFSSLSTTRNSFTIQGEDRGSSYLVQNDPTGLLDGIHFTGQGKGKVSKIGYWRAQAGIGHVSAATIVAGGSGYAVGDTLTVAGGTFSTAAVLTVTSVSSGAITGLSVSTPGAYTAAPPPTATMTSTPAVQASATSGSGSQASFKLWMDGPALIRFTDHYMGRVEDCYIGSSGQNGLAWDGVTVEDLTAGNVDEIYISRNQIEYGEHAGVTLYGSSSSMPVGDAFIDEHNYVRNWGYAGVLIRGNAGAYITDNAIYGNGFGIYDDTETYGTASKIRANDIDTNTLGSVFINLANSLFQNNWVANNGPIVFSGASNLVGGANNINGSTDQFWFNGSYGIAFGNNIFSGMTNAINLGVYNSTATAGASFGGTFYGGGAFVTASGSPSPSYISVSAELSSSVSSGAYAGGGTFINVIGPQFPFSNISAPSAKEVFGSNNSVTSSYSGVGGYGNSASGYASFAFGQNNSVNSSYGFALGVGNTVSGAQSAVRGTNGADDGNMMADCWGSQAVSGVTLTQCQHVLFAPTTSSTTAVRLTSDGNAAASGGANCIRLGSYQSYGFEIKVVGQSQNAGQKAVAWSSAAIAPGLLSQGNGAATTTYAGPFSSATQAQTVVGSPGGLAYLQLSADSDEAGHAFQYEAGHLFRSEAGQRSDLKPATCSLPPQVRIDDVALLLIGQERMDFGWTSASCAGSRRPNRSDRHCG